MKIIVAQDLDLNQIEKTELQKLGTVKFYDDLAVTHDQWLERCRDADIICTGKFGFKQKYQELNNVFISLPFVGTGFLDPEILKRNNITVSRCPGCNKDAVSEWIIAMTLNLFRNLPHLINNLEPITQRRPSLGLTGKIATILGPGNIGSRVGKILETLDMEVNYFNRNDNLLASTKNADLVINTLASNSETEGLLDQDFFSSLKPGSFFVTVTGSKVWDVDALISAIDQDVLAGAAVDCGSIQVRDTQDPFYLKLAKHPKVLTTPHIAFNTDVTDRTSNKMMIENIVSYLSGKTINQVT